MRTTFHPDDARPLAANPVAPKRNAYGAAAAVLLCLLLGAATGIAVHRGPSAPIRLQAASLTLQPASSFAFADFDGDRQPDLATAEIERSGSGLTRYLIRLNPESGGRQPGQSIGVTGAFGLPEISALDVNGDHVPDLVITAAGQRQPIAILLNDGQGRFSVANPSDFPNARETSPSGMDAASRVVQDLAVLAPARSPQLDAGEAVQSSAPQRLATLRILGNRPFIPDSLRPASRGRAPPALLQA